MPRWIRAVPRTPQCKIERGIRPYSCIAHFACRVLKPAECTHTHAKPEHTRQCTHIHTHNVRSLSPSPYVYVCAMTHFFLCVLSLSGYFFHTHIIKPAECTHSHENTLVSLVILLFYFVAGYILGRLLRMKPLLEARLSCLLCEDL